MRRPRAVASALLLLAGLVLPVLLPPGQPGAVPGARADVAAARPAQDPPPAPDPDALATLDSGPRALPGVRARTACVTSAGGPSAIGPAPWSQQTLGFVDAWRFTQGEGQTIAVIDTGVARHPRLAGRLADGGDFVADDGGLVDCDGHGTLVAGIIAAAPDPATGFVGVAPRARILSIRQSSATVSVTAPDGTTTAGGGDVRTLAAAIVHAVRLGADVINVSEAACVEAAGAGAGLAPLRAAVRAAVDADRVVVAAAGNAGTGACANASPGQVVAPAWFADDVLSVGYTRRDGLPAPASIRGPWVSLSAPGSEIVSLDPAGPGVVDRITPAGLQGAVPIEGTSFATPYVSGVVALVRSRYPGLGARAVMERLRTTASHPAGAVRVDDAVGAGTVDPVAAVAEVLPGESEAVSAAGRDGDAAGGPGPLTVGRAGPDDAPAGRVDLRPSRDADSRARSVALVGSAGAVALLGGVAFAAFVARRGRRPPP